MTSPANARTPVPPDWDASMLPDLTGKTAIVTGAETDIGFHIALQLVRYGAHVVVTSHLEEQGTAAQSKIHDAAGDAPIEGGKAEFMELDMSKPESVKAFAARFKESHNRLDILINSAYTIVPQRTMTSDGFELQFVTNYLGHFVLVSQLIDVLRRNPDQARIVSLSSPLHKRASFNVDALMMSEDEYTHIKAYGQTKLYLLQFAFELQRRLDKAGVTNVISLGAHSGVVTTRVQKFDYSELGLSLDIASKYMHTPERGALSILYGAAAPGVLGGDYYAPDGLFEISGSPSHQVPVAFALSEEYGEQLWSASEKLAQLEFVL